MYLTSEEWFRILLETKADANTLQLKFSAIHIPAPLISELAVLRDTLSNYDIYVLHADKDPFQL